MRPVQVSPIDIKKALLGMSYPATAKLLLEYVTQNGATIEVIDAVGTLPHGRYKDAARVIAAIQP